MHESPAEPEAPPSFRCEGDKTDRRLICILEGEGQGGVGFLLGQVVCVCVVAMAEAPESSRVQSTEGRAGAGMELRDFSGPSSFKLLPSSSTLHPSALREAARRGRYLGQNSGTAEARV